MARCALVTFSLIFFFCCVALMLILSMDQHKLICVHWPRESNHFITLRVPYQWIWFHGVDCRRIIVIERIFKEKWIRIFVSKQNQILCPRKATRTTFCEWKGASQRCRHLFYMNFQRFLFCARRSALLLFFHFFLPPSDVQRYMLMKLSHLHGLEQMCAFRETWIELPSTSMTLVVCAQSTASAMTENEKTLRHYARRAQAACPRIN